MCKVISLATGKRLSTGSTHEMDNHVRENGRYIGCLPMPQAEAIRTRQECLIVESAKLAELTQKLHQDQALYQLAVAEILRFFKEKPGTFDETRDHLAVGSDGHTWIVKREL